MAADPLRKAQKDFQKGYFSRVLSSLEPLNLSYRDSHQFYFLMGASCLVTGDIGGAATYLRRAEQLNFRHSPTLAALAAVHVRRGETDKAIQLYLDILSREPGNTFAQKSLLFLKSNSDPDRLAALIKTGGISVLYPIPSVIQRIAARYLLFLLVLILAVSAIFLLFPQVSLLVKKSTPSRPGLESFLLSDGERKTPVSASGEFQYVLTEREALASFERTKALFSAWNDEAALVEINRLLLSNAASSIKRKAEILKSFIRDPDFINVKERYSYSDVARSPMLFNEVAVIWKGQASNVREYGDGVQFDFLVGYQNKTNLEGIASVFFTFPLRLTVGVPLEILGRIQLAPEGFRVEGIAVHELREDRR